MPYYQMPPGPFEDGDLISCHFSRKTIESGDLEQPLRNSARLLENSSAVRKFQDAMIFSVGGYDDDKRELWEIPEVRRTLGAFDRGFPEWLHFSEKMEHSIKLMVLCITPLTTYGPNLSTYAVSPEEFAEIFNERVKAAHRLQIKNGFSKEERDQFAQTVTDYIVTMNNSFFRPQNEG